MDRLPMLATDAVPQRLPVNINENTCNRINIVNLLNEFSEEDYKSVFFLLMDFIGETKFLTLTKKDKPFLKKTFIELYEHFLNDRILVELLGTLKMYKKLRMLDTCHHVYESQEKLFSKIHQIWKILYSLCEELTDEDFQSLKEIVPLNFKDQILSSEDWFCWALQNGLFSRTDISNLENMFRNYPSCLNIIKSYQDFGLYDIRTPTATTDNGIAVIINNETFDENSKRLEKRVNSHKDVLSLLKLWNTFGFKTYVYENLTCEETFKMMESCALMDHSDYDAFVCCILSHGQSNGVFSSDGELMPIPDLLSPVVNGCPSLNNKPKLFFIQACQGPNFHEGAGKPVYHDKAEDSPATKSCYSSLPPVVCDTLIVNSSIDGYVSFRGKEGSWFIQALCNQMMQYGDTRPIEEVMIEVNKEVTEYSANFHSMGPRNFCQIVPRHSTLAKKLILKKRDLRAKIS